MKSSFTMLVRRTLANLLDTTIELTGGVLGSYFGMVVAALLASTQTHTATEIQSSMWSGFGFGLIFWTLSISLLNRVLVQGISRATIGKKVFKLELISNGEALSWGTMIGRWMLGFGSFALFGLGYVYAFLNKEGRTLHDLVANTDVIPIYEGSAMSVEHKEYVPMPMPAYSAMHKIVVFTQVTSERPMVSMIRLPSVPPANVFADQPVTASKNNVVSLDEARVAKDTTPAADTDQNDSGSGSEAA